MNAVVPHPLQTAVKLFNQGMDTADVAAAIGVSRIAMNGIIDANRVLFAGEGEPQKPKRTSNGGARTWTDADIEEAARLWKSGKSLGEIGIIMGRGRSAVGGIANRHRDRFPKSGLTKPQGRPRKDSALPSRGTITGGAIQKLRQARASGPVKAFEAAPKLDEHVSDGITLIELTSRSCRWPVSGEKAATLFCGAATDAGSSWCTCHRARSTIARPT